MPEQSKICENKDQAAGKNKGQTLLHGQYEIVRKYRIEKKRKNEATGNATFLP